MVVDEKKPLYWGRDWMMSKLKDPDVGNRKRELLGPYSFYPD